jgi:hypothetical protein
MLEQSTVTIMMHVLLTDAQTTQRLAGIRLLFVMTRTLAPLTLVTQFLDVFTHHWLLLNWTITTLAPETTAHQNSESNTKQSNVTMETLAPTRSAMQSSDASTLELYVTTTTFAPLTSALLDNVFIPLLFAQLQLHAQTLNAQEKPDFALLLQSFVMTIMLAPLIHVMLTPTSVSSLLVIAMMLTSAPRILATLQRDAKTFKSAVMTAILALMTTVILKLDVSTTTRLLMTRTHVPEITAFQPLVK